MPAAAAARTTAIDAPARAGVPGPGEIEHTPVAGDDGRRGIRLDRVGLDEVGVGTELVEVADEGVDEAVVVVDDEDRRGRSSLRRPTALTQR